MGLGLGRGTQSVLWIMQRYNLNDRKTLQSYLLRYVIKELVIILIERLLEAVKRLSSIN